MRHIITTTHLIRYMYNEVSYLEKMAIELAIKNEESVRSEYQQLQATHALLDGSTLMPETSSIQNILNYSSSSRLEETF